MNEIEQMFEQIREYHQRPKQKRTTGKPDTDFRKRMIIKSQRKKN